MSKTLYIEYGNSGFWAYDVAAGVFLKHLIDQASLYIERYPSEWMHDCIDHWRFNAVIADCGIYLDENWTEEQRQIILALIGEACRVLGMSKTISAEEAASWKLLAGEGVYARGLIHIPTEPVINLGRAIGLLIQGALPQAPKGYWWFYGVEDISTIAKKTS